MVILYILIGIGVIILLIMFIKKMFHLRVDDNNYNDEDDYLDRRIKKDDK